LAPGILAGAALALSIAAGAASAQDVPLTKSFVARYGVALAAPNQGVQSVTGGYTVSVVQDCQDWRSSRALQLQIQASEGRQITVGLNEALAESVDGARMRFETFLTQNGNPRNVTNGQIIRAQNGDLLLQLSRPQGNPTPLPREVEFPMARSIALIQAIGQGHTTMVKAGFLPSSLGVAQVSYKVLGRRAPETIPAFRGDQLSPGQLWEIEETVFVTSGTTAGRNSTSRYVIGRDLIATELRYVISGLEVVMTLQELDRQPANC